MLHPRWIPPVALVVMAGRLPAQARPDDSLRWLRPPIVRTWEAVGIGGAVGVAALLDPDVRDLFQTERSTATNALATIGDSFGHVATVGPALVATWLVGTIAGEPDVANAALWAAGAGAAAGIATVGLKAVIGRSRPRTNLTYDFHPFSGDAAFPSGHTSFAFAVASSLAHATKDRWSDLALYAAATLTGLSRINDDKHWLSDVVGGAALGILVGRQLTGGRVDRRTGAPAGPSRQGIRIRPALGPRSLGISAEF